MKAKLIKKDENYFLEVEYWYPKYIRPAIIGNTFVKPKGDVYDLSISNCDEIFGIIDVEKLAYVSSQEYLIKPIESPIFTFGYEQGFNKAMELDKDKVFTLEDMMNCWNKALKFQEHKQTLGEFIQSLQQPTEVEVEIEMETCSMNPLDLDCDEIVERPKLDSNGCLILKKI